MIKIPPKGVFLRVSNLIVCTFLISLSLSAQDFVRSHIDTKNGLNSNSINTLFEDQEGYIWIGTERGILRYDGYNFEDIGSNWDRSGQPVTYSVRHIGQHQSGTIVAATEEGLLLADPHRYQSHHVSMPALSHIFIDGRGDIYCLTDHQRFLRLQMDRESLLWNIDDHFPPKQFELSIHFGCAAIAEHHNKLWFGSKTDGLFRYDPQTNSMEQVYLIESGAITSILVDHKNQLWVGSDSGLFKYEHSTDRFSLHAGDPDTTDEASSESVMGIYEDHRHRLWISRENQLAIYDPVKNAWQRKWFFANKLNPNDPIYPTMASELANRPNYNLLLDHASEGKIWSYSILDNRMHCEVVPGLQLSGLGYLSTDAYRPQNRIIIKGGLVDRSGKVWVGTEADGIFTFSAHGLPFSEINSSLKRNSPHKDKIINSIDQDHQGNIWLGEWSDRIYLLKDGITIPMSLLSAIDPHIIQINAIECDQQGILWIGTSNGLFKLDLNSCAIDKNHALYARTEATSVEYSNHLPAYAVDGNLNTRWASLMYAPQELTIDLKEEHYISDLIILWSTRPQSYTIECASKLDQWRRIEHRHGDVGSIDQINIERGCRFIRIRALERFNIFNFSIAEVYALGQKPVASKIRSLSKKSGEDIFVYNIVSDKEKIWALTSSGLGKVDQHHHDLQILKVKDTTGYTLENDFHEAMPDLNGRLWIVNRSQSRIVIFDPETKVFSMPTSSLFAFDDLIINKLAQNRDGIVHILTNRGLWRNRKGTDEMELISPDLDVLDVHWGVDQRIWLGTNGQGLHVSTGHGFVRMNDRNLPNQIANIHNDQDDHLWLGSVSGFFYVNTTEMKVYDFSMDEGVPVPDLSVKSYKDRSGQIYYLGSARIHRLDPSLFVQNRSHPSITITSIMVNDSLQPVSRSLTLPSGENNLRIHFSAMHHDRSEKNTFSYRLSPLQPSWIDLGTQHQLNLSGLSPGKYELMLKSCNADHICMEAPYILPIRIKPPWYLRWWALACWALVLAILIRTYLIFQRKSFLMNQELLYEKKEANRLRELDKTKSRFFTNVSHEFRTPLTVIGGMARQIKGSAEQKEIILKNTQRLQRQINHILDLGKLESGQWKSTHKTGNLIAEIQDIVRGFEYMISEKRIKLSTDLQPRSLIFEYDPKLLEGIVFNLISNALKFTPVHGEIDIKTKIDRSENLFIFSVQDSGPGIPDDLQDKIFDRFHQIDDSSSRLADGSGIGLAIVKEFVQKLNGQIHVHNRKPSGAKFVVYIPLQEWEEDTGLKINTPLIQIRAPIDVPSADVPLTKDEPIILMVEDNYDMARYLVSLLKDSYNLRWAKNGKEGLAVALELIPDIIISDIMMPQMDGLDLLAKLRKEVRCSHIPVILLTAKASDEEKKHGLEKGALVYLTKPFDERILRSTIDNTLYFKNQLIERLKYVDSLDQLNIPEKRELVFLRQLDQILLERLDEEQFGTHALASTLSMSVSQLYRKLKAITGQSIAGYIKEFRLSQAKILLENSDLTVGEISYRVGFTSPAYFSRIFKDQYHQSPTNIRQKTKTDG